MVLLLMLGAALAGLLTGIWIGWEMHPDLTADVAGLQKQLKQAELDKSIALHEASVAKVMLESAQRGATEWKTEADRRNTGWQKAWQLLQETELEKNNWARLANMRGSDIERRQDSADKTIGALSRWAKRDLVDGKRVGVTPEEIEKLVKTLEGA